MAGQVIGAQAAGNHHMIWEVYIREMSERAGRGPGRRWRMQCPRREHGQKYLTALLTMAVAVCMFLTCAISYRSIKVQANTGFKYYTAVTVENGDTLWSIADKYIDYGHYKDKNAYIAEVESINRLDADEVLLAGQMLIVPYYSAEYVP